MIANQVRSINLTTLLMRPIALYWLGMAMAIAAYSPIAGQKIPSGKNSSTKTTPQWSFGSFGEKADGTLNLSQTTLSISTQNTLHCFGEADSYSFAYQKQAFPFDDCSKATITVKIKSFASGTTGIMIRSSISPSAANAHLEVSSTGDLLLMSRKTDGTATSYTRMGNLPFPIEVKLVRQGSVFTGYSKNSDGNWIKGGSVIAEVGTESLVGVYACSGSKSQIGYSEGANGQMQATFENWTYQYQETYIPPEKNWTDKTPIKPGTLLRENFDDGSLSNIPASSHNPVWNGIKLAYLPYAKAGGRYWRKTGDGLYALGDKKWADYETSVEFTFHVGNQLPEEVMIQVRNQQISAYTHLGRYYAVSLRDKNKLFFEKYESGTVTYTQSVTIPNFIDGKKHTLKIRLLDRDFDVVYDNASLIKGTDVKNPITYGSLALKFTNADVDLDNLEVIQINDLVNGSADNYLLDYFDTPLPAYLKKYGY